MKYATWKVYFPEGSTEGSTADQEIVKRGGEANGMFAIDNEFIIFGRYSDDSDISGLEQWEFTPLSEEQALLVIQDYSNRMTDTVDPVIILPDGTIIFPAFSE